MMDVFRLSDWLIGEYEAFSRSFVDIRSEEIRQKVDAGYASRRFWPAPLLQINPHYKGGESLKELVGAPGLHRETAAIFRAPDARPDDPDPSLKLHRHQAQAIEIALSGRSYVVTTGTGSGKSLCFFIPIVDAILKAKQADPSARTRAIIIYPMNALANSQMEELRKFLGDDGPVRFARYTGQESPEDREKIRDRAPDILLTNFMMLELLMTRQSELDQKVLENCRGLEFIVLDELHTYRGRQGADVAMLMRRLKARVCEKPPIAIGTSATMSSAEDEDERNRAVADVASRLFGVPIGPDAVITETLKRRTDDTRSADQGLSGLDGAVRKAAQPGAFAGRRNAELAQDALAIWVETRLGLRNVDMKPERARPIAVETAVARLAEESGVDPETCAAALKEALLAYSQTETDRGVEDGDHQPLFAFRLHQLISGAGRVYVTLDPAGRRTVTFDGQVYDPDNPDKRLYAAHFCRKCGQEHHPVFQVDNQGQILFEKREIDDVPVDTEDDPELGGRRWGFLMPEPVGGDFGFGGAPEDYPEPWQEATRRGEVRLKASFRKSQAIVHDVRPDGTVGPGGVRAWFMPGKFKFCPACGDYHTDATRDINRLASLSAEGRSSATTVLIAAMLRWMHEDGAAAIKPARRKLLAFTDNRQDAALQAGHFNDFVFVTLLRGAILAALEAAGPDGLSHDRVGLAIQNALGFVAANATRRVEWMVDPEVKGAGRMDAERAMREGLAHRFWIDQRRGWRFTNPNLEQLGLLEADYVSLDEMCADEDEFAGVVRLAAASPAERAAAARTLLDTMRRGLAVEADALDRTMVEALAGRMRTTVKPPWSIAEDRVRGATTLVVNPPKRAEIKLADEVYLLRGSARSLVGREIRKLRFGGSPPAPNEVSEIIDGLIAAAKAYGLITARPSPVGRGDGWRLNANVVVFRARDGLGPAERTNAFFCELYRMVAGLLAEGGQALFGFEGREHTAQVDSFLREMREARFRYGADDLKKLQENSSRLKEESEDSRFLPTLFCSPTMELGVDISAMNVVYLRNMPPTPANYVQRSGRAGRSGQAALIVTYCAAQSPHDQYFFANPAAMVAGVVKSPTIDLANKGLVDSHLHAEWLAASGLELQSNIPQNLDMTAPGWPLSAAVQAVAKAPDSTEAGTRAMVPVLTSLVETLSGVPWFTGAEAYAASLAGSAADSFDRAFSRWRDLFAAAEKQRDDADRVLKDYSISEYERRSAQTRLAQALGQINLLLGGSANVGSDFFVYRFLATEGFLPGYNFPRLPLMAFIPGESEQRRDRYLQRARFLAIAEFGPGSLVYHEGRAYRVDKAMLGAGGGIDGRLITFATIICPACGAGHDEENRESCHLCGHPLTKAHVTRDLYRIDNVATRPVERITSNDEDRRRQGFDIQTTVHMPADASRVDVELVDAEGHPLASMTFAPAARIRRINRGLRRRKDEAEVGFQINPRTGRWLGKSSGEVNDPSPADQPQRITPVVEDHKNALMIRFPAALRGESGPDADALMVTLQHALARGIEANFQLEEGEILGEPTPNRGNRNALLFYEAAEGGAGALGRLVQEVEPFRSVAFEALRAIHLTEASIEAAKTAGPDSLADAVDTKCVAGCYQCLLSYYNQPDQADIDRRLPALRQFLLRLLTAEFGAARDPAAPAGADGLPPPDAEPIHLDGVDIPLVWRRHRLVAVEAAGPAAALAGDLEDSGFEVVLLPAEPAARAAACQDLTRRLEDGS
ncbi:MAG: DEAD/DEAH box helicase [Alphaproteobacteria bacterium]|jgi:Lhr-like helicase|nr:DEAD/DEAH box helicase [Alphaproteobacteria bacterium]